jgi:hypothetical protein
VKRGEAHRALFGKMRERFVSRSQREREGKEEERKKEEELSFRVRNPHWRKK